MKTTPDQRTKKELPKTKTTVLIFEKPIGSLDFLKRVKKDILKTQKQNVHSGTR